MKPKACGQWTALGYLVLYSVMIGLLIAPFVLEK